MSDSLWSHILQLSPVVCLNSCPLSWWYHPTISSSVTSFSSHPQSFPASGSFPMSQLFASGGQSTGALASATVLSMNIQCWFLLGMTGLTSLLCKGTNAIMSNPSKSKRMVEQTCQTHVQSRKWKWKCRALSCVWLFATLRTVTCQAPLSMGLSRQ